MCNDILCFLLYYEYSLYVIMKVAILEISEKQKGQTSKLTKRQFCLLVRKGVNLRRKYGLNKERNHMIRMCQWKVYK